MWEVSITKNWSYLEQRRLQEIAPENSDLKDTWFTPNIKENPSGFLEEKTLASQQSSKTILPPRNQYTKSL